MHLYCLKPAITDAAAGFAMPRRMIGRLPYVSVLMVQPDSTQGLEAGTFLPSKALE